VERVEAVFRELGVEPSSALSPALQGLRTAHDELSSRVVEPRLKDVFLADGAARTEHLELALYASLIGLAVQLGADASPLEQNVAEEEAALHRLERASAQLRDLLPR
jgi:ferritin-like metal-binding protein YciE